MRIDPKVLLAFLLLATVCDAMAGCDQEGKPEIFLLMDSWRVKGDANLGHADFENSCDELIRCYSTYKATKRSCDAMYSLNLKKTCSKAFGFHPNALASCNNLTERSVEFVEKEANAIFRKGQRQAGVKQRLEERNKRAEKRKTRAADRRKRRINQYSDYNADS